MSAAIVYSLACVGGLVLTVYLFVISLTTVDHLFKRIVKRYTRDFENMVERQFQIMRKAHGLQKRTQSLQGTERNFCEKENKNQDKDREPS